jgi:hypothetical protein
VRKGEGDDYQLNQQKIEKALLDVYKSYDPGLDLDPPTSGQDLLRKAPVPGKELVKADHVLKDREFITSELVTAQILKDFKIDLSVLTQNNGGGSRIRTGGPVIKSITYPWDGAVRERTIPLWSLPDGFHVRVGSNPGI